MCGCVLHMGSYEIIGEAVIKICLYEINLSSITHLLLAWAFCSTHVDLNGNKPHHEPRRNGTSFCRFSSAFGESVGQRSGTMLIVFQSSLLGRLPPRSTNKMSVSQNERLNGCSPKCEEYTKTS